MTDDRSPPGVAAYEAFLRGDWSDPPGEADRVVDRAASKLITIAIIIAAELLFVAVVAGVGLLAWLNTP